MLQLLGPVLPNLPYLYSTSHLEYLLILSSVTVGGPVSPRGTCSQVLRSTSVRSVWRASKFPCLKLIEIVIFVGLLHHPFWLQLVLALFGHYLSTFDTTCLGKDH